MEDLEIFGIVVVSESFEAATPVPGEETYATGFIPTDTVSRNALANNPTWRQAASLGFRPVAIAKAPKSNYSHFQLFAVTDLPEHLGEFAKIVAPTVVQEWLSDRLREKYGDEVLAEWNKECAGE